jgi:cytidylate kinase
MIVAIDGPAGSGKSTVARALATRLGFRYLDTGAMYRCVALTAIERWGAEGVREHLAPPFAGTAMGELVAGLRIELGEAGNGGEADGAPDGSDATPPGHAAQPVLLDGRNVTVAIRTAEVSEAASAVAEVPSVRTALVAMQRALVAQGDWVAEGRDVGTVVAPTAELKVFLTADPDERARRRAAELGADPQTVLAEQTIRDARDTQRQDSPLAPAGDALTLDTTSLTIEQVVERIAELAQQHR